MLRDPAMESSEASLMRVCREEKFILTREKKRGGVVARAFLAHVLFLAENSGRSQSQAARSRRV